MASFIIERYKPDDITKLRIAFLLIGIGSKYPFNAVITCVDYFQEMYGNNVDFYLSWLLLLPNIPILALSVKYGWPFSYAARISLTSLFNAIIVTIIPIYPILLPSFKSPYVLYVLTFLIGCLSSILQGSCFALISVFGASITSMFQTGIAMSGAITAAIKIITKLILPNDIIHSTYIYFGTATLISLLNIFCYMILVNRSQYITARISRQNMLRKVVDVEILDEYTQLNVNKQPQYLSTQNEDINDDPNEKNMSVSMLFNAMKPCVIAIFINYTVTSCLFPGMLSIMTWKYNDNWWPIIQLFTYNFFDTIGKYLPFFEWFLVYWNNKRLLYHSLLRILFIPVFILCVHPRIFNWPIAFIANIFMAITTGYIGTLGFCMGPDNVKDKYKEQAGNMSIFTLFIAMFCGSTLSVLIASLISYDYI